MKYIFTIILSISTLFAQSHPEEYLKSLENSKGTQRIDILNKISEGYRNISDNAQAIDYAEKALSESLQNEYTVGEIDALNNLASTYILSQQLEPGIEYARGAESLAKKNNYKPGIATAYRNLGAYYIYSNKPQPALDTLKIAVEMFQELSDSVGLASALMGLGAAYTRVNEIETAITLFEDAADIFSNKGNDYQAAHAYLNLGSLYSTIIGDYQKGLDNSLNALEKFHAVNDQVKAAYAMIIIGNTYEGLGNYDKPIEYYSNALLIFENTGNAYLVANAVNNLGEVYKHRREFNIAIEYYIQALDKSKEINNEEGLGVALNNIGECYYELENYLLANDYYIQSYEFLERLNDKNKMSISLNNQAAVLLKLGNYYEAISKSKKAIALAEEVFTGDEIQRGYENLYNAYKSIGNFKAALENYLRYEEIKDSLVNERRSSELAKTLADFEAIQREKEIELLRKNSELKQAKLDRQENLTYFFIIISIMLLVFGVVYYMRYTERKSMNQKLLQYTNELNEINRTKDLFFSIIAHDLRGPFNSLLGITDILAEDNIELTEDEIKHLSKEVNQNARNVFLLLENLLEWSSAQLGKITFNPTRFDLNEIVTQNINLYRKSASNKELNLVIKLDNDASVFGDKNMIDSVTRNLINNAIKYTEKGGEIKVFTQKNDEQVLFTVEDNGVGIPQDELSKIFDLDSDIKKPGTENEKGTGLGLILSNDFVKKNNGTISVESIVDKGTIFKVSLPVK